MMQTVLKQTALLAITILTLTLAVGCGSDSPSSVTPDNPVIPTPPAAPYELQGNAVSPIEISLTWRDSARNEEHFELYSSIGDDANFSRLATLDSNSIGYTHSGLTPATKYYYKVRAVRLDTLLSDYSNTFSVTTPDGKPLAPANLRATSLSTTSIQIYWEDRSSDETGFKLMRRTKPVEAFVELVGPAANDTAYTDIDLTPSTTYYYQVVAINGYGTNESNIADATTGDLPPIAPTELTGILELSTQLTIRWKYTQEDADEFRIEQKEGAGEWTLINTVGADTLSVTVTGLTPNTAYTYRVWTFNNAGASATACDPLTLTPISAPVNLVATTVSASELKLEWSAVSIHHSGFKIERKDAIAGVWNELTPAEVVPTVYSDINLNPDNAYYYRVRALSAEGTSSYSDESSATTLRLPPATPTNVVATNKSGTELNISWKDNSNNEDGFWVYRRTMRTGWSLITTTAENVIQLTDAELLPATKYFYRLQAFNNGGVSDTSTEGSGMTSLMEKTFALGTTGLTVRMCWIPEGINTQGSLDTEFERGRGEGPRHNIDFGYGFWMAKFEATQKEWLTVMGAFPDTVKCRKYGVGDNIPIYAITWNEVHSFIDSLNAQEGSVKWRLPSETEWEYACRATTTTRFYCGDDPEYKILPDYAWFVTNAPNSYHNVGLKKSNAWNLSDMHGNAAEFTEDYYHDTYDGAPADGSAWVYPVSDYRVTRGGSWYTDTRSLCRSAARSKLLPTARDYGTGFRLVRNMD